MNSSLSNPHRFDLEDKISVRKRNNSLKLKIPWIKLKFPDYIPWLFLEF